MHFCGQLVTDGDDVLGVEEDELLLPLLREPGPQVIRVCIGVVILDLLDAIVLLLLL